MNVPVRPLEGVAMAGSFISGRFRFQVEGSDWDVDDAHGFDEELVDDAFDLRLTDTGRVPNLGGAPLASWLLARLARLTDNWLGLGAEEDNDGGGYLVEFVVYLEPEKPIPGQTQKMLPFVPEFIVSVEPKLVAAFQFQADMEGVAVLGQRVVDCDAEKVLEALAAALLAAPEDLMARELAVRDPEWKCDHEMYNPRPVKGTRNWYGWDGFQFLGKDNVREAPW
jgi:hypothetical protein